MNKKKIVYILGAGASSTLLPTQNGILDLVFSISQDFSVLEQGKRSFLSMPIRELPEKLKEVYDKFDKCRQKLGLFIVSFFSSIEKTKQYENAINQAKNISIENLETQKEKELWLETAYKIVKTVNVRLEDLFTIFDNVSVGQEWFKNYSFKEMAKLHSELKKCIIYALSYKITYKLLTSKKINDYTKFSKFLLKERLLESQKSDSFAVITMNWDDVLERTIYKLCNEYNSGEKAKHKKVFPDLCIYNYDYKHNKNHFPSIHTKARGSKNIKILKMHGSLAWLECPRCGRIFTDYESEIAYEEFSGTRCNDCKDSNNKKRPKLRNLILTPTFMKSFNNLYIKNIWHNAYIDISEADHIVFIGYSLPDADFEMRCLLKKSIKDYASIEVVLSKEDNPKYYEKKLRKNGCTEDEIKQIIEKMELPPYRYNSFFGNKVKFRFCGFGGFLKKMEKMK